MIPDTSSFYGNWVEDVRAGQFIIFCNFVGRCLVRRYYYYYYYYYYVKKSLCTGYVARLLLDGQLLYVLVVHSAGPRLLGNGQLRHPVSYRRRSRCWPRRAGLSQRHARLPSALAGL